MRTVLASMLLASWLVVCGDSDPALSAGDAAVAEDDFKGCPEDIPAFTPGLRTAGDHVAARLLAAKPAEPERYNENDWTSTSTSGPESTSR
jgi:hypothetical protein